MIQKFSEQYPWFLNTNDSISHVSQKMNSPNWGVKTIIFVICCLEASGFAPGTNCWPYGTTQTPSCVVSPHQTFLDHSLYILTLYLIPANLYLSKPGISPQILIRYVRSFVRCKQITVLFALEQIKMMHCM